MIQREISNKLKLLFSKFPIVAVTGPRQSGKTTLTKQIFPDLPYVNMEDISLREYAESDPKGFLRNYKNGLIIDEIQHVPSLFSYIQVFSDDKGTPGQYILTGSQHFLLNEKISQSLAGRVGLLTLLPLAYSELSQKYTIRDVYDLLYKGCYPRLHNYDIDPSDFYTEYIQTYLEKDVRQIQNILNLSLFKKFV